MQSVAFAINQQMMQLTAENLHAWLEGRCARQALKVGVLNAGNIPLVGLQDWLAVLLTGHAYQGAASSKSPELLPAFAAAVKRKYSSLNSSFVSVQELWSDAQAVIATGSNVTRAWCRRMAKKHGIPGTRCLLRGHRYSVAVVDGQESATECDGLAEDVLLHDGAGCRSVALIFAPHDLAPDRYMEHFAQFRAVFPSHPATPRTLTMAQAFLKAVDRPHAYGDGLEFLVSRGEAAVQGPGHVRWVPYEDLAEAVRCIDGRQNELQCVAARPYLRRKLPRQWPAVNLGDTQRPELNWCPDGTDIVAFLAGLS